MGLFSRESEGRDAIQIGRTHEAPAEIHYSSGTDRWWYHGPLWVQETRPVREGEFNPILRDPRNRSILRLIRRGWTDEQIAGWLVVEIRNAEQKVEPLTAEDERSAKAGALAAARQVRGAFAGANEPHVARVYGLKNATKTDERILVTIDQDLIHEAPMIRYTQTEKGSRRLQLVMMGSMAVVDAIFLWVMVSLINAGPAVLQDAAVVQQTAFSSGYLFAFPIMFLAVYVWMARRTLVLDMEIQPVVEDLQDTHSEAVYLVNSEKTPAATYLSKLYRTDSTAIQGLTEEVARFQSDTIANLQDQARSLRSELDSAKMLGVEAWSRTTDLRALGQTRVASIDRDPIGTWVLMAVVAVVVGVAVWAAIAAGA
jgi:hypothetical protein